VIDVQRQSWIWTWIIVRIGKQHVADRGLRRNGLSRSREVLAQGFSDEASEGDPPCARSLVGPSVQFSRNQELSPVHV
jgi:hypothetical protein